MLTDEEVQHYRRLLNVKPEDIGGKSDPIGNRKHGIPATYGAGCRCDPCKAAHAARQRKYWQTASRESVDARNARQRRYRKGKSNAKR